MKKAYTINKELCGSNQSIEICFDENDATVASIITVIPTDPDWLILALAWEKGLINATELQSFIAEETEG